MPQAHVTVGTGKAGSRFLNTDYPFIEGLTLGTTKIEGRETGLVAQESVVSDKEKEGLCSSGEL